MTILYPESTPVLGNVKVTAITSIADQTAPSLAGEIQATSSVEMSCSFMANGWTPSKTQNKGTKSRRLCSKVDVEQLNASQATIGTLMYSVGDPQNPNADIEGIMAEGSRIYLLERLGLDAEEVAWAEGDKSRSHYIELGEPVPMYDTTDDNGEFYVSQEAVYVSRGPISGTVAA